MTVTASLVVQLGGGAGAGGLLKAEIDDRSDGFNNGDTDFRPGDPVYYLVYTGSNTRVSAQQSTLGAISSVGKYTRDVEEVISFANARTASLSYPVSSGLSVTWMGPSPGVAQLQGDDELVLPAAGLGIATVKYKTAFEAFRLSNLPGTVNGEQSYSVLIVITGEVS